VPRFFPTGDEFVNAAQSVVADSGTSHPVAFIVGDVDGFTALAEVHGESYAGEALESIARIVCGVLRDDDLFGRGPRDQFLVLLREVGATDAHAVAARICSAVRAHSFASSERGSAPQITISVGIAGVPEHGRSVQILMGAADAARAHLKETGRDGWAIAPQAHHEALHRPLAVERFAGRVQELASLVRWMDEAFSGKPRVVTVMGESGAGTATLLRQLEPEVRLRGGTFVMAGSSDTDVREPYAVWARLAAAVQRVPDPPTSDWQELQNVLPALRTDAQADSQTRSQYRLLEELSAYFRATAQARPLVLVLDEMQWAEVTSWDALHHLIDQLDSDRLMVCIAMRSDAVHGILVPQRELLLHHETYREIALSRLTRDEVKQWLEAAFHRQQVAREFLAFLYRHTEGNPLFIVHLLRALVEEGAVWHSGASWEWATVSELRVPAGLSALIARRIARFSSSTQAVLSTAAIVGREFDIALVAAAGAGSEPAVRLALSEGLTAGLLKPTYERDSGGYAFTHESLAHALLTSIPRDRMQSLHHRVAQALEQRGTRTPGEIAGHYDRAGDSAAAYAFSRRAAADAEHVHAHTAAVAYLQMAARNAGSPGELAEVRVSLAHLAETDGRFDEVEELCDLAIEWFDGQGDSRRALTLRRMRERARMELGQPARVTLDALAGLDTEAARLSFDRERVTILTMASQTHGRLGDARTAERIASECVEMAEQIGDATLLAEALNRHGAAVHQEAPAKAHTIWMRALNLFEVTADVRGQARCHNNIGVAAQFEGRVSEAASAFTVASSVARTAGMSDLWGIAALNLGVLSQKSGDYERAREQIGQAIELFASVKNSELQLLALYNMASVERERGDWESALKLYETTSELAQRVNQSDVELGSLAGVGLCYLELNLHGQARDALRRVDEQMATRPDWFQGRELAEALAIRLAVIDGRSAEALRRLKNALGLAEASDLYTAAWLTAACANALDKYNPGWVSATIARYASTVTTLGYPELARRYEELLNR
jgi:diguanylate cyclase (GGDEF)-like protein